MSHPIPGPRSVLPVALAGALFFAALPGCGPRRPPVARVEGTVTLGGQPVAEAAVTFTPVEGGRPASGATDGSGRFRLGTFGQGDGAVLGEHVVTVFKEGGAGEMVVEEGGLDGGPVDPDAPPPRQLIPPRYASRHTSDLRVTVARGMGPVEIRLEPE
jgi:hypothetical protein